MSSNKRKFERFDLQLTAYLKDKSGSHKLKTGNISRYGLFLLTPEPKPLRQLVKVQIEFPGGGGALDVLAQVMWSDAQGGSDGQAGMGLKFFSIPEREKRRWEEFVDRVRAGQVEAPHEAPEAAAATGVYVIGEEELEELGDIDLNAAGEAIDDEEIIAFEESTAFKAIKNEEPAALDLSQEEAEYETAGGTMIMPAAVDNSDVERRLFPRKEAAFRVRLKDQNDLREVVSRDISQGGLFLRSSTAIPLGETLPVLLIHPWTSEELPVLVRAVRLEKTQDGRLAGVGVEFAEPDESLRDTLLTFIESGFVIEKTDRNEPIEGEVIKRIEGLEKRIAANPMDAIDPRLHFELALLYLFLSTWDKGAEHLEFAQGLGYAVPPEVAARFAPHQS